MAATSDSAHDGGADVGYRHDLMSNLAAVFSVSDLFDSRGERTIIETGAARGRRMTSWPSLRTDLKNAGAEWVDQEVVVSDKLVTSRKPDDIPAFNREMIALFSEHGDK